MTSYFYAVLNARDLDHKGTPVIQYKLISATIPKIAATLAPGRIGSPTIQPSQQVGGGKASSCEQIMFLLPVRHSFVCGANAIETISIQFR